MASEGGTPSNARSEGVPAAFGGGSAGFGGAAVGRCGAERGAD